MDDKLYEIFSENTDIPAVVREHAQDALFQIQKETKKTPRPTVRTRRSRILRPLLIAAALTALLCTGVIAAEHYFGISDFFKKNGRSLEKAASDQIAPVSSQTVSENPLVEFTVKEALYDSEFLYVLIHAQARTPDSYLLVPDDLTLPEDPISTLGIDSPLSIAEYAAANHKEILYVGCGLDHEKHPDMATCNFQSTMNADGSLTTLLYGGGWNSEEETLSLYGHVRTPDAQSMDDILSSELTFSLQNTGNTVKHSYVPADTAVSSELQLHEITLMETDLGLYAEIHYTPTDTERVLVLDLAEGDILMTCMEGGSKILEDGSFLTRFSYEKRELPDTLTLLVSDLQKDEIIERIPLTLSKK